MKLPFLLAIFLACAVLAGAPRVAAQNGAVQFTARITPSGGVDEPVRSFPFYLLRKSYADIEKEAAASYPEADMNAFIDKLDVSPELKKWMKKNHWVNLSGGEFVKKLTANDIIDVPEFFSAYVDRENGDATVTFPQPKYKPEDKKKDPEKYARLKKQYYDAIRAFFAQNPDSADGIDLALGEINPTTKWDIIRAKDQADLERRTAQLAQGSYLAGRGETDLDGQGFIRGVAAGTYWLSSLDISATVGNSRAQWDVPVTVQAGKTVYVALSDINSVPPPRANP